MPEKNINLPATRTVVFPLENRLTAKLIQKKEENYVPHDIFFYSRYTSEYYLILYDPLKSQCEKRPRGDLELSVSAYPERNVSALRAKIFDTLEQPIGFARLPRRTGVGTVKTRISTVRYPVDAARGVTSSRQFFTPLSGVVHSTRSTSATGGNFVRFTGHVCRAQRMALSIPIDVCYG